MDSFKDKVAVVTGGAQGIGRCITDEFLLVKCVFDAIPSELAKEDKRFILADLEKGASCRKYEDPTQWLIDAGIAYYSFNTTAFELPFEATENRKLYKLYMVDTGLLGSILLKGIQFQVQSWNRSAKMPCVSLMEHGSHIVRN